MGANCCHSGTGTQQEVEPIVEASLAVPAVSSAPSAPTFHESYRLLPGNFGQAASGQFHKAVRRCACGGRTGLCVKICDFRKAKSKGGANGICAKATELSILEKVGGAKANCVELIGHFLEGGISYLVLLGAGDANLWQALEALARPTQRELALLFQQMLVSLARLATCGVVHRDITPDQFACELSPTELTVKLCNFRYAASLPKGGKPLNKIIGTAPYMSPEMVRKEGYGTSTDMWSFGVLAYLLLMGHFPYQGTARTSKAILDAIAEGSPAPIFKPAGDVVVPQSQSRSQARGWAFRGRARAQAAQTQESTQDSFGPEAFLRRILEREVFSRCTAEAALEDAWLLEAGSLGEEQARESFASLAQELKSARSEASELEARRENSSTSSSSAGGESDLGIVLQTQQEYYDNPDLAGHVPCVDGACRECAPCSGSARPEIARLMVPEMTESQQSTTTASGSSMCSLPSSAAAMDHREPASSRRSPGSDTSRSSRALMERERELEERERLLEERERELGIGWESTPKNGRNTIAGYYQPWERREDLEARERELGLGWESPRDSRRPMQSTRRLDLEGMPPAPPGRIPSTARRPDLEGMPPAPPDRRPARKPNILDLTLLP